MIIFIKFCYSAVAKLNILSQLCTFDKSTKIGTNVDFHLIKNLNMEALSNIPMVAIATDSKWQP